MQKVFSIFDSKSMLFSQPFFSPTKGSAIRAFEQAVNDPKTDFNKYPNDFTLFEIGDWHEDKGIIEPTQTPINIGLAIEFKKEI